MQNTLPEADVWLPLSRPNGTALPVVVPVAALGLAMAATAYNRRMTTWARSLTRD